MRRLIVPVAIALVAAALFSFRATYDPDLFWHLTQGREVLAGHLLRTNALSATAAGYPQYYTSWGFEALAAAVAGVAGGAGVQWLQFGLIACALLMLYASARVRSSRAGALAVLALSLCVIEPRAMPRPYLFSWIGLALCAWAVERWTALLAVRRIPLLLACLAIWSNLHAEVVLGVGFLGLFGLCELARPSVLPRRAAGQIVFVALFGLVMTLGSPYGAGLWRYLIENTLVPQSLRIAELQSPTLSTYPAFFAYLIVLVVLLASQPRRLRLWEVAVTVVFAWLGLRYIRFTPLLVFATAPIVAARIDALLARGWDWRAVAVTTVTVVAMTAPASPQRIVQAWRVGESAVAPPDVFSSGAIAFARANGLGGPLFNSMNLGGYISWHLPQARVFQDSRLQAYPPQHFAGILRAAETYAESPVAWRTLVADVDWAMVSLARPNELSGVGKFASDEWASVYRDRAVEIYVRRSGKFGAISR